MGSNSKPPGYAAIDNEVESDLESTTRSEPKNGRNGNGGNNGCSYKAFLACNPQDYDGEGVAVALTRSGRGQEAAMAMTWSAILTVGILTDEAIHCGTFTRSSEKRKEVEETNLIPLGHGSFDVIMKINWLSKNKVEIVCHEKVVRISLEGGEILCVQGERTLGGIRTLMSTRTDEPELSDIPVVQDFTDVFLEDLSGLPPQRQLKFYIDLIPRATPVAKSLYRLAPSKMQGLSEQLQELQDKGFIQPSYSP
nr:putative reverse transcriptase domain-containing protein [Tanacetum cinerariifolium]